MQAIPRFGAAVTTVLEIHDIEIESYEWDIKIPPNLFNPSAPRREISVGTFRFATGTLSKADMSNPCIVSGRIYRDGLILKISFQLPSSISNRHIKMRPFTIDFMDMDNKMNIDTSTRHEFPPARERTTRGFYKHRYFSIFIDLKPKWTLSVDTVRITFFVEVEEAPPTVVTAASSFTTSPHRNDPLNSSLKYRIGQLYKSKSMSDMVICCQDEEFPAHRAILSTASCVFSAMFQSDTKENWENRVVIVDIDKRIVGLMLQWIYSEEVNVKDFQAHVELFKAGHKYCIDELKRWSVEQIVDHHVNMRNAIEVFLMGTTYDEIALVETAKSVMKSHKRVIFQDKELYKEFLGMYPDVMFELFLH